MNSCARYHYTNFWTGELNADAGLELDDLTENEKIEFDRVIQMGKKITDYDKFSWESTDILLKEYDMDENKDSISGWVIVDVDKKVNVCFGQWKDSKFIIKKTVQWNDDEYYLIDSTYENLLATKLYKSQNGSIMLNKDYLSRYHDGTNIYSFINADTITVYLIPATTRNDIYVFGGGIRTVFVESGNKILRNDVLQPATYVFKKENGSQMTQRVVRPTYNERLIDEVDYFQTVVTGHDIQGQYILNINYPRMITYVKTAGSETKFLILKDNKRK